LFGEQLDEGGVGGHVEIVRGEDAVHRGATTNLHAHERLHGFLSRHGPREAWKRESNAMQSCNGRGLQVL
jgi:hypothetical protein